MFLVNQLQHIEWWKIESIFVIFHLVSLSSNNSNNSFVYKYEIQYMTWEVLNVIFANT